MRGIALLCVLAVTARAQDTGEAEEEVREVGFRDAVALGLAYNLGLRSARLTALMERLSVRAAEAAWDPTVTSGFGMDESLVPARSELAGADVVDTDNATFALGLSKPFSLGPVVGLNWRTDRSFNNSSFSTINPAFDSAIEVSLVVPLLRGRGRVVNEADLRASRAGAQAAHFALLEEAALLVEEVGTAYWDLAYTQARVRVLEKSVEVAREIEASERRKLEPDIGRSTALDVTKAVSETKRREVDVLQGRLDAANASDTLRRLVLPFTGGPGDAVVLRAIEQPSEEAPVPGLAGLVDDALTRRPDLLRIDAEIARLHESVVKARNDLRVQLDFRANVSWREIAADFGTSAANALSGDYPSVGGRLDLTVALGRRAARAALRRAELEFERAKVDRQEAVSGVILEVRKAHRALRTAIEGIAATREEVNAASAALEGERRRLERGSATILDVAQLEANLTEAQLRMIQAYANREQARVAVSRVSGRLLEQFGIALAGDLHPVLEAEG